MRSVVVAVAVLALGSGVAACGSSSSPGSPVASSAQAPAQGVALPIAACGSATDTDIAAATGLAGPRQVSANPLRCRWEAGTDAVTFEWFRASPIDAHTPSDPGARVTPVRIGDHAGKVYAGAQWCEVSVDSGAGDFIDWRIDTAQPVAAQSCSAVQQLATATLTKAGRG